jgi:hypothetical protein
VTEFLPQVFSNIIFPRSLIILLSPFRILLKICKDICRSWSTNGINNTGSNLTTGVIDGCSKFAAESVTSVVTISIHYFNSIDSSVKFATGVNNADINVTGDQQRRQEDAYT